MFKNLFNFSVSKTGLDVVVANYKSANENRIQTKWIGIDEKSKAKEKSKPSKFKSMKMNF